MLSGMFTVNPIRDDSLWHVGCYIFICGLQDRAERKFLALDLEIEQQEQIYRGIQLYILKPSILKSAGMHRFEKQTDILCRENLCSISYLLYTV